MKKLYHTGTIKKSITINARKDKIWEILGNIASLPQWVIGVKKTEILSKKKKGIGSIRKIILEDGTIIEEHTVRWDEGNSFSYVATSGLPLRVYYATITLQSKNGRSTAIWESYFNSQLMTKQEFDEFVDNMTNFYSESLTNLKNLIKTR